MLNSKSGLVALTITMGIAATLSAGTIWVAGGGSHEGGDVEASCGSIWGRLGVLQDWEHSPGAANNLVSYEGWFGAEWDGARWPMCPSASQNFEDSATITHSWNVSHEDVVTPVMNVLATTVNKASGDAAVLDPESPGWWWWAPTTLYDHRPTMTLTDGEEVTELGWDNISTNDPSSLNGGGGSINPAQAQVLTPTTGSDNQGAHGADSSTPDAENSSATIEVKYKLEGQCNRTSDNASVYYWMVYFDVFMETRITFE